MRPDGYGRMGRARAHRLALIFCGHRLGPLDDGHHVCENRGCVRVHPDHVVISNYKHRGKAKKDKTHCPRGHEYNERNTYIDGKGYRQCRVCKLAWYHNQK
jgi:hypothetical protein